MSRRSTKQSSSLSSTSTPHTKTTKNKNDELFFQQIADAIPGMVAAYDVNSGKYIFVNKAIKKLLGYKPEEFTKKDLSFAASLVHPDDIQTIMEANNRALKKANRQKTITADKDPVVNFEYRIKHKNGSWRWLHTDGSVLKRDREGKVSQVLNVSLDITARKLAEQELAIQNKVTTTTNKKLKLAESNLIDARQELEEKIIDRTRALSISEERYRLALNAGKIGVWDWDIRKNHITWSDRVYDFHGIKKGKFSGKVEDFVKLIHPDDNPTVSEAIRRAMEEKLSFEIEFRALHPNGKIRWLATNGQVLFDDENNPYRMLGATIDTTERKQLERQKDEFLGIASHELKTPVTSLKAYTQVMHRKFTKAGNDTEAAHLARMDDQLDKLTNLIGDLLDVTKIEAGKLLFNESHFAINSLISEIVYAMQLTTSSHTIIREGDTNKKVYGDRERIGQVLTNLLSNAIKYSPKSKKIIVTLDHKSGNVIVGVKDFGIGITKDNQKKIFDRFYRATGEKTHTFPGLGLGLYISQEIIKRQNGTMWVKSIVDKGSKFYFSLPIDNSPAENGHVFAGKEIRYE